MVLIFLTCGKSFFMKLKLPFLKYPLFAAIFLFSKLPAQDLPHYMTPEEQRMMKDFVEMRKKLPPSPFTVTPPPTPVRTIAEWEELQALVVVWKSFPSMNREIIKHAKAECKVLLLYEAPDSPTSITTYLSGYGIDTVNVQFVNVPLNSVWCRDYGPWSAYTNEVDTLITIDWIYNRPTRPDDDAVPASLAALLGTPFYETTTAPWDLVHTGGNFMTDGFGTGFASNLTVNENGPGNSFGVGPHTPADIDSIMNAFMGINRFIKMSTLPYDVIHHIDMHMKLLDEETLLVGEYPQGVADGPQIEANLQYVLSNFNSVFGTPYKVIRIPMPPDGTQYPNNGGDYFTYTNSSFINKTIIVPIYNSPQDSAALAIYREALPGYNVVGINSLSSIPSLGALHCITKEIGTTDPLLISHQPLEDTYDTVNAYDVIALAKHRSGIQAGNLYFRTDTTQPYTLVAMTQISLDTLVAQIPAQPSNTDVYYYVEAASVSGKTQVRPLPAPSGYWHFRVLPLPSFVNESSATELKPAFPNPSKGITCIPVYLNHSSPVKLSLFDINGRLVETIFNGDCKNRDAKFFVNTSAMNAGLYLIRLETSYGLNYQKLIVR